MRKTILLIDDDVDLIDSLRRSLVDSGYDVLFEYGGEAGYLRAVKDKPDLIILDIHMPINEKDGYEIYNMLKDCDETSRIPVLILSGLIDLKNLWEDVYGTKFICKPFDYEALLLIIEEVINSSNA